MMKRIFMKIFSLFAVLIVMMTSCIGNSFTIIAEDIQTTKINTNLKVVGKTPLETSDKEVKVYEINTGAIVNLYANFEVSGTDVDINNATIKIWLPKDGNNYIKSVNFTGSYNASKVVFSGNDDPNEFSVSYQFNRLRGGMVGGYPFSFKFENIITPPNIEQPVYFSIYDENGDLVYNKEDKVILRSVAYTNYDAKKYIGSIGIKSYQYLLSPDYLNTNPPETTPSDPQKTRVTFYNQFVPLGSGTGGAEGEYRPLKVKVVDHIPEGALFLENDATNVKYGWTKINENTYETVLEKSNPKYTKIFEERNFAVPIVLAFPNRPLSDTGGQETPGRTTEKFTNISEFFYYTIEDEKEKEVNIAVSEAERSATVSFYYRQYVKTNPANTDYSWNRQIINGRENYVNISDNPDDISVINGNAEKNIRHVPLMDFMDVYPNTNPDRLVWKAKTDVTQYTRTGYSYNGESLKRMLDRVVFSPLFSTGFTDDGVYYSKTLVDKDNNRLGTLNSARFYVQDMIFKAEINDNLTADESNSLEDLKKAKFWVFKTFGNYHSSYYAKDNTGLPEERNINNPYVLVPLANHPFSLDETIKINDEGGYYNGYTTIATDDLTLAEVAAIKNQSVIPWEEVMESYTDNGVTKWRLKGLEENTGEEHSLRLKNVKLQQIVTYRPVREGGKSITEKNEVYIASHKSDFLAKFSEDVLRAKNDDDPKTIPSNIIYALFLSSAIPPEKRGNESQGFDQVEPHRYYGENQTNTDTEYDTAYFFKPNNAKINLSVSDSKSYLYIDHDPEHIGSFRATIFDAKQDLKAKNVKGFVLLPPGVEYISTETFGLAKGEPEIVNNFKNSGRQAIVYSFDDIDVKANQDKSLGSISYKVRITKKTKDSASTQEGNSVETWLAWDNPSLIWASEEDANGIVVNDSKDLNQNNKNNESLLMGKYDIYYYAPAETIISKFVSDDSTVNINDSESVSDWGKWTQDSKFIDIGSNAYFRMFLVNQYIKTIDQLTVVEKLPDLNDHKMVANEAGVYPLRGPLDSQTGSFFPVHLTKKLGDLQPNIELDMFNFEYTVSPILSDQENPDPYADKDIVMEDQWIKEAELDAKLEELNMTMEDITGFRAILKEGKTISGITADNRAPVGEDPIAWYQSHPQLGNTASIYIPTKLPFKPSLDRNVPAYMSTAYKLAKPGSEEYRGFSLNEGNEVTIRNMYYTISGTVFRDYKHTGDLTSDRIKDISATLEFAEDTVIDGVSYPAGSKVPSKLVRKGRFDKERNMVVPVEETPVESTVSNTTTTDENGNYYFVVYKRGKYQVRFETNPDDPKQSFVQYGSNTGKFRSNLIIPESSLNDNSLRIAEARTIAFDAAPTIVNYNLDGSIDYLSGTLHNVANAAIDDQKRDLIIYKYGINGSKDETSQKVALSANFNLTSVEKPEYSIDFTTDAVTGEYRIEDLPYGKYILKETQAPEGLVKLEHPIHITVSGQEVTFDSSNEDFDSYQYVNERIEVKNIVPKGSIKIIKKSSIKSNQLLENVLFGIYQNNQPVLNENNEPIQALSDENGVAIFENLPAGTTYTIKEEKAAVGFTTKWQKTESEIVDLKLGVDFSIPLKENAYVEKELNNIPFKATIKVKKADEDGKPLKDTIFGLFEQENPDIMIQESKTNEVGIAVFNDVYTGNYIIKEIQAIQGYIPIKDTYKVSVVSDGATYWIPKLGTSIQNEKIRGNIKFTKVDESGNALSGVKFDLYQGSTATGEIYKSVTTNESGEVLFENLEYGDYTIKESITPEGYVTIDDLKATIKENNKTVLLGDNGKVINKKIKGVIQFIKVDEDAYESDSKEIIPLENVVFKLYKAKQQENSNALTYVKDGNAIQTITTGVDGLVKFTEVPYGHYVIEEESPALGYNGDPNLLHVQIVEDGQVVSPTEDGYFTNKIITGNVSLKKIDENGEPLAGAKFQLANQNIRYEATSNENGDVIFTDIIYGTYTLTEIMAPEKYDKWNGNKEAVIHQQGDKVDLGTIQNTLIRGSIEVHKISYFDQSPLENARFMIYQGIDDNGNPIDPVMDGNESYIVTTNSQGKAVFENLPYGTYYVQEIQAPEGYLINPEIKEVHILETKDEPYHVEVADQKIRGSIEITKQDGEDHSLLKGARFKLYQIENIDGKEVAGEVFKDGEMEFEGTTDENGIAVIAEVPYGTYMMKEIEAPEDYVLDENPVKVTISNEDEMVKVTVLNKKQKGTLKIVKTSSDGKVDGFTFNIEDQNHNIIEKKTDKEGIILVENLVVGEYRISEVEDEVSKDYDRPESTSVIIRENEITEITLHNVRKLEIRNDQPTKSTEEPTVTPTPKPTKPTVTPTPKPTEEPTKTVDTSDSGVLGYAIVALFAVLGMVMIIYCKKVNAE